MWAIGVISYFLLCGYTPFERENNVDEMNAIMHADYTFDEQYWSTISDEGKRRKNGMLHRSSGMLTWDNVV